MHITDINIIAHLSKTFDYSFILGNLVTNVEETNAINISERGAIDESIKIKKLQIFKQR